MIKQSFMILQEFRVVKGSESVFMAVERKRYADWKKCKKAVYAFQAGRFSSSQPSAVADQCIGLLGLVQKQYSKALRTGAKWIHGVSR
jgi:hypothetical protein